MVNIKLSFNIHIQSYSDLITNSSSETFVVTSDNGKISKATVLRELKMVRDNSIYWRDRFSNWTLFLENTTLEERYEKYIGCSGDGGTLEVKSWEDMYNEWKDSWIPKNKRDRVTPEIWSLTEKKELDELKKTLTITVDEYSFAIVRYIFDNYVVTEDDCWQSFYAEKDPDTGRILKRVSAEDYEKLPKERKAFYDFFNN